MKYYEPTIEEYLSWFNFSPKKRKKKLEHGQCLSDILSRTTYDFLILNWYNGASKLRNYEYVLEFARNYTIE